MPSGGGQHNNGFKTQQATIQFSERGAEGVDGDETGGSQAPTDRTVWNNNTNSSFVGGAAVPLLIAP
jgi:hypothetical protein